MPRLTATEAELNEFKLAKEKCFEFGGNGQREKLVALMTAIPTQPVINHLISEKMIEDPTSPYPLWNSFYNHETIELGTPWKDITLVEHPQTRMKMSWSQAFGVLEPCDSKDWKPGCDVKTCSIGMPTMGLSQRGGIEVFQFGLNTEPLCLEEYSHIRNFREIIEKYVLNPAFKASSQITELLMLIAMIRYTTHKMVLEMIIDPATGKKIVPRDFDNRTNILREWSYNHREHLFPGIMDPNNTIPLQYAHLERLANRWNLSNDSPHIGRSGGAKMYTLITGEDFFATEILGRPHLQKLAEKAGNVPAGMIPWLSIMAGSAEHPLTKFGNWTNVIMEKLPRWGLDADGRMVIIDPIKEIPLEFGVREIFDPTEYENANFGIAYIPDNKPMLTVLQREKITSFPQYNGEFYPIGDMDWTAFNEYDKDCNPMRNKPHWKMTKTVGFKPHYDHTNYGATAIIYRRRIVTQVSYDNCDLQPITTISYSDDSCNAMNPVLGCAPTPRIPLQINGPVPRSVAKNLGQCGCEDKKAIECFGIVCDDPNYIKVDLSPDIPAVDYNPLGCKCDAQVTLWIHDRQSVGGGLIKTVTGVVKDTQLDPIFRQYKIQLDNGVVLQPNECVRYIRCGKSSMAICVNILTWREIKFNEPIPCEAPIAHDRVWVTSAVCGFDEVEEDLIGREVELLFSTLEDPATIKIVPATLIKANTIANYYWFKPEVPADVVAFAPNATMKVKLL